MLFFARGPTWPASDAAGAARNPWRFMMVVSCRQLCRSTHLPAARLRPSVGPPKKDMLHFTVARTRIRRQSCTRTHENARPNHQTDTDASIVLSLNAKRPSEPSDRHRCVNRFPSERKKSRPNHQKEAPSVNRVHARTNAPVRTVRQTPRRQ